MATLYHFTTFQSLSSHNFFFSLPPLAHHRPCSSAAIACSIKKPRANRRGKSSEELCTDLREFLSMLGLPKNHVPSTNELSQHGRKDLANIVRRRGYKYVRNLLENSNETNVNACNTKEELNGELKALGGSEDSDSQSEVEIGADGSSLSSETIQKDSINCTETDGHLIPNDQKFNSDCSPNLSLQEKVAHFIQNGELDIIEDGDFGITNEMAAEDVEGANGSKDTSTSELASMLSGSSGAQLVNGNVISLLQNPKVEYPVLENSTSRNYFMSTEEVTDVDHPKNTEEADNQDDIKRLKFLLHQKQLELTHLKQQVEKEKLVLSDLQTKAEAEISKAQQLISEKDAELHAAEETLTGLKEVEVEYSGDGESVELAGSFNGWHHKIKMDLHQPSSIINPTGSRKPRLWRTVLWLYPGIYEIKFIVDGDWRIDPQKESIDMVGIHNNILRVDR